MLGIEFFFVLYFFLFYVSIFAGLCLCVGLCACRHTCILTHKYVRTRPCMFVSSRLHLCIVFMCVFIWLYFCVIIFIYLYFKTFVIIVWVFLALFKKCISKSYWLLLYGDSALQLFFVDCVWECYRLGVMYGGLCLW